MILDPFRITPFQMFQDITILLISAYLFGMVYGCFHREPAPVGKRANLPQAMAISFLWVFVAVYFVFFGVKLAGVPKALQNIENGLLWVSTYAREGFFELCAVAAVNFLIFTILKWYSPEAGKPMRITLTILGVQTIGFVCLGISKMGLYISRYGLTHKRVLTSWFITPSRQFLEFIFPPKQE